MRSQPGWKLTVLVLVVLPVTAIVLGPRVIFQVFGDGHNLSVASPGYDLIEWWDHRLGREIVVAAVALVALLVGRTKPHVAAAYALGACALTYAWWLVVVLVLAIADPGAFD